MKRSKVKFLEAGVLLWALACVGCSNDAIDPKQIGRFQPVPVVNVILENLGVAEEPDPTYAGAEPPRPEDLISYEQDYVLGIGDVVRISIYELRREGFPFVNDYIVTESGRISIPDVGQVRAAGLTEKKLEDEIRDILSPSVLKNPSVSVLLLESQSRYFTIYGWGIGRSGRFPIPRTNFRLSDAIALGGDVGQFNVSHIFVARDVPVDSEPIEAEDVYETPFDSTVPTREGIIPEIRTIEPAPKDTLEEEMLEIITPFTRGNPPGGGVMIASAELAADSELEALAAPEPIDPARQPATLNETTESELSDPTETRIEWIFEDGRWKPVRVRDETAQTPSVDRTGSIRGPKTEDIPVWDYTGWSAKRTRSRVIEIPVDKFKSGDPRYDVVIRPGDRISVPGDVVGEFYVTGNVNNGGTITLTGRPMTLKMAIAAAGGLNELAWPKKVEVVRRLGRNEAGLMQEEIVMVDLEKIAKGLQPDFFIKPHDVVNVGTHGISRWLAVLRNAFRATYGFGFIYDRNFADRDYGNSPFPGHISF
ncbi:MAG: polysaccharide biosynthesis/export family protein [Sedimentisphaerales bacterium]|nr:polysaccharide biosynthesis/export family protein [Sedimentisphaerales bacterium]